MVTTINFIENNTFSNEVRSLVCRLWEAATKAKLFIPLDVPSGNVTLSQNWEWSVLEWKDSVWARVCELRTTEGLMHKHEGSTLREETWKVRAVGQEGWETQWDMWGSLGAMLTWHLERRTLEMTVRRTAGSLSFLFCSLHHETAGIVLPLLFTALSGLFSTLSPFPDLSFDYSVNIR